MKELEMTFLEWLLFIQRSKEEKETIILNNSYLTPIM